MPDESSEDSSRTSAPQADGAPQPTAGEVAAAGAADSAADASNAPGAGAIAHRAPRAAAAPADATAAGGRWPLAPDVAHVRSEIEHQIRAKPGRALLIALGVGYVVGRIFRGKPGS